MYAEELTDEVQVVTKVDANLGKFTGLRFYLDSSPKLHQRPDDDDRSAVTFWGSRHRLKALLHQAMDALEKDQMPGRPGAP